MIVKVERNKPIFDMTTAPCLCTFRSSKSYVWGLLRERMHCLQKQTDYKLKIWDAACHALITREIFPQDSYYFGIDIAKSRLSQAFKRKRKDDVLFWGDLCKPIPLHNCFDIVNSCNTFSHLPIDEHKSALINLVNACKTGGHLFINLCINDRMMEVVNYLDRHFREVEVVYYDSFLSKSDEELNLVNSSNVADKVKVNEFNLLNDASLHAQVLFLAKERIHNELKSLIPKVIPNKIIKLTHTPVIQKLNFESDEKFLSALVPDPSICIAFTSKLIKSEYGYRLRKALQKLNIHTFELGSNVDDTLLSKDKIYVLGLELEWSENTTNDRVHLNKLKQFNGVSIHLVLVATRDDSACTPSLVAGDH